MKITETIERDCCEPRDLKPVAGTPMYGRHAAFVFCVHCGTQHYYDTYTDAAGSRDWRYTPMPLPWRKDPKEAS